MTDKKQRIVWIDLDNSPHVLFFDPIIKELQDKGIEVLTTARDYAQVIQLAELFKIKYIKVGKHFGKNKYLKILGLLTRSFKLATIVMKRRPLLALSHGSRSQIFTAKLLRIKSAMAFDYELARGLPFFRPNFKLLPDVIPDSKIHLNAEKIIKYPGIKEDVYIHKFLPDPGIVDKLKLEMEKVIVTIRPPAFSAHYYVEKSKDLFYETINYISVLLNTQIVITPRTIDQKKEIYNEWKSDIKSGKVIIPEIAVNGLNLIWYSDLVISGGGTMIREAAALKVPAYSIFGSEIGSVDKYLSEAGRLVLIRNKDDVKNKIRIEKRIRNDADIHHSKQTLMFITNSIMDLMNEIGK